MKNRKRNRNKFISKKYLTEINMFLYNANTNRNKNISIKEKSKGEM